MEFKLPIRFSIRSLLVFTAITAVACFAVKQQRDRARALALETERASIQNQSWAGQAQVVANGDYILLRNKSAVGVIQIEFQSMEPEQMKCKWWYRDDGDGHVFRNGIQSSKTEIVDWQLKFGGFDLQWSGASEKWGWIYLHKHPKIKFLITQQNPAHNLDLISDTIGLRDLPNPKPYDKTITIDWP
jgi:hypothetical protein